MSIRQISLRRGDTEKIPFQVLDTEGLPIAAGNVAEIFFTVKLKRADEDDDAMIAKTLSENGIEVSDEDDGRFEVVIDPEDTLSFAAQRGLHFDIQMVALDGSVYTLADGLVDIVPDVTRRVVA